MGRQMMRMRQWEEENLPQNQVLPQPMQVKTPTKLCFLSQEPKSGILCLKPRALVPA